MEATWRLLGGHLEAKLAQEAPRRAPRAGKLVPRCAQEAASCSKLGPRGAKLAPRGAKLSSRGVQEAPKRLQVELRRRPSRAKELQNSSSRTLVQEKSHNLTL